MEFKGTKGKWELSNNEYFYEVIIKEPNLKSVCAVNSNLDGVKYNALLISKSPLILSDLKDLVWLIEQGATMEELIERVKTSKELIKSATKFKMDKENIFCDLSELSPEERDFLLSLIPEEKKGDVSVTDHCCLLAYGIEFGRWITLISELGHFIDYKLDFEEMGDFLLREYPKKENKIGRFFNNLL